ncbi:MAG: PAS domain S-box protein [Halodesulfurarchaeum sp.]
MDGSGEREFGQAPSSEGFLRSFAPYPYQSLDVDGSILAVNDAWIDTLGYDREAVIGRFFGDILTNASRKEFESRFDDFKSGGRLSNIEFEMVRADDSTIFVSFSGEVECDDQGNFVRTHCQFTDTTGRKRRKRELQKLKQKYESLATYSSDIITVIDANGRIKDQAPTVERLLGFDANERHGDRVFGYIHPEDREQAAREFTTFLTEGKKSSKPIEYRYQDPDGSYRWLESEAVDLTDTTIDGYVIYSRDITDRKERERKLQRYHYAYESALSGIAITNLDGELTHLNPSFLDLWGYEERGNVIGRQATEMWKHPDKAATVLETVTGQGSWEGKLEAVRADGSTFMARGAASHLTNSEDNPIGIVASFNDISDLEENQRQLRVMDRVLRHNVNNNMNVIRGFAEIIQAEATDRSEEYAERIIQNSDQLLNIAQKQRKITEFLSDPDPVGRIDLDPIVDGVLERIRSAYPEASISVERPGSVEAIALKAIGEAIEELLTNSIIHADPSNPNPTLRVTDREETVQIQVADRNEPIAPIDQQVLEGGEELNKLRHGSGLGLGLIRLIVNHSEGAVSHETSDPRGNLVTITLEKP